MAELGRKYIILYVILLVTLFIVTHLTSALLTQRQVTEMLISSILFVFLFGIIRAKVSQYTTHQSIAMYGFYYTLWYFITKTVTNAVMKDGNGVILTS